MKYSNVLSEIAPYAAKRPITLVAVTKHASLEQMKEAYGAEIRHFGEQRLQTALEKMPHFPSDVIWHFIGPLQSNKLKKIVEHFSYIHSVESVQNALDISKWAKALGKTPQLFLQVNVSQEPTKHGFTEEALVRDYPALVQLEHVNICGLMTIAPLTENANAIERCFSRLAALQKQLELPYLSMGMSQDYVLALDHGATHLRIGSSLFA